MHSQSGPRTRNQSRSPRRCAWTLVDFNDQHVGRLTLLRDLLDRLPDTQLPYPAIDWLPLATKPLKEQFGVLKPIPNMQVD